MDCAPAVDASCVALRVRPTPSEFARHGSGVVRRRKLALRLSGWLRTRCSLVRLAFLCLRLTTNSLHRPLDGVSIAGGSGNENPDDGAVAFGARSRTRARCERDRSVVNGSNRVPVTACRFVSLSMRG